MLILRFTAWTRKPLRQLWQKPGRSLRWDFVMAPETVEVCAGLRDQYDTLAGQRVWGEWQKLMAKSRKPSAGLAVLEQTGWRHLFPVLERLAAMPLMLTAVSGRVKNLA